MSWTDERVALIKSLWAKGLSAGKIAAQLGDVSRNAVISKLYRSKVPGRVETASKPTVKRVPPKRTPSRPVAQQVSLPPRLSALPLPPETVWKPLPGRKPVALLDLEPHHCRWPVDGGSCGCNKVPGLPYCEQHAATAFRPAVSPSSIPRTNVPAFGNTAHKNAEEFLKEPA